MSVLFVIFEVQTSASEKEQIHPSHDESGNKSAHMGGIGNAVHKQAGNHDHYQGDDKQPRHHLHPHGKGGIAGDYGQIADNPVDGSGEAAEVFRGHFVLSCQDAVFGNIAHNAGNNNENQQSETAQELFHLPSQHGEYNGVEGDMHKPEMHESRGYDAPVFSIVEPVSIQGQGVEYRS